VLVLRARRKKYSTGVAPDDDEDDEYDGETLALSGTVPLRSEYSTVMSNSV
jgi:hypothetical protein